MYHGSYEWKSVVSFFRSEAPAEESVDRFNLCMIIVYNIITIYKCVNNLNMSL